MIDKRKISLLLVLALALVFVSGVNMPAQAASADVVISQVYGGGGNSGAPYTHDYVELFNRGTSSVSVSGWSIQYASATGTGNFGANSGQLTELPDVTLAPGQYLLIQEASGGSAGVPLPTPDVIDLTPINMAAGAGKVALASGTTSLGCNGGSTPCTAEQLDRIIDLVGYGNANFFEGTGAAPTLSNITAAFRANGGCTDTDDNAADFTAAAPAPRNSASPLHSCTGPTNPTGVGSADPASVVPGGSTLLTVTVTPGANPASTGLAVTADLTAIGGSAAQPFADNGGNTFTFAATVDSTTTPGAKNLPVTISDDQNRIGNTTISLTVTAPPAPAGALVISQVYGGGGNAGATYTHDFIELFNRSASAVDISGWSVQYASAAGTSWLVTALSGSIQPGQYYLVQQAQGAGGTTPLPAPDASGGINMAATNGKVALVNDSIALSGACPSTAGIVDFVGFGTANCFEGSGATPALTNTTAALREDGGCTDTDDNAADFATGAPTPRNTGSPFNHCDGPKGTGTATPNSVAAGDTTLLTVTVTLGVNPGSTGITVTGDLTPIGGSATQAFYDDGTNGDVTAGDNVFSFLATIASGTEVGATSLEITINDDQNRPRIITITFSVLDGCSYPFTPIYEIQGSGSASPIEGTIVSTEGVVVGDFQGPLALNGFYIQDPVGDGDPETSDGLFVFAPGSMDVAFGDTVRVNGTVTEFGGLTEISNVAFLLHCSSGHTIEPVTVSLPVSSIGYWERYEGMLVTFEQELTVTEHFNLGRFGEVHLSVGGRLFNPTNVTTPGAAANALQDLNDRSRILLDDANTQQNRDPIVYPAPGLTADNTLRTGYTVSTLTGILDDRFGEYRIQPVGDVEFSPANPRPAAPDPVGGSLTVASFNVLNYFTTFQNAGSVCGPSGNMDCRGAINALEFMRQRDKIISALVLMDADIVGLIEMENNPSAAVADLVSGLNDVLGAGAYAYIDTGTIGTDAIKQAFIYQPASVTPVGAFAILDTSVDPRYNDGKNRPALAQTFVENATGAKFTVVVNHLKSKGSDCNDVGDPDTGDGQGNCNVTRTLAAEALADWLATDPTGSGDPDFLIIGDLNAYAMEDPITALKMAGYTDLLQVHVGPEAYSYVFAGQSGYLDHALANASLASQVTGATAWLINADEPRSLDYTFAFKSPNQWEILYNDDPYRSSDHDPVIVGLNLNAPPDCSGAFPSRATLWPATHMFVAIDILGVTDPDGDAFTITIDAIRQDEAVNAPNSGDTAPDGRGVGTSRAEVRAERAGDQNGRVYHIYFTATDVHGNACSGEVLVGVPLSLGSGPAIDDGPLYDSTVANPE